MILESLRAAVAFLPLAWSRPWFRLVVAIFAVIGLTSVVFADPADWIGPVALVAAVFFLPAVQAPLYALALDTPPTQPTMAEGWARYVRLLVVGLLTDVFLAIPGLLVFVVGLGTAYGLAYSDPGFDRMDVSTWTARGPVMAGSVAVLGLGGLLLLWLSARVGLGAAATSVERRVLMLSTWPMTRGMGVRITVARIVVTAVVFLMVVAMSAAVRIMAPDSSGQVAPIFGGILLLGLRTPLKVGVLSYFYRHRSPSPEA